MFLSYEWQDFTHEGHNYRARLEEDQYIDAPWDNEDGHGDVSDWTSRGKSPGELVLSKDGRFKRYFDFAGAVAKAKSEGWGFMPYPLSIKADDENRAPYTACGGWAIAGPFKAYDPVNFNRAVAAVYAQHKATFPSAKAYAAAAAMADFKRLRDWCNDEWCYVGVIVELLDDEGEPTGETASLWGIESDCDEYLAEVAIELTGEIDPPLAA